MPKDKFTLPFVFLSILLAPLIGMQITDDIQWSLFDFIIMGLLLLVLGFGIQWIWHRSFSTQKKRIFIVFLVFAFILVWVELAVGVFGSPLAGN
ncbi:MAG: hypothetical protein ACPF99_02760 [Flavobacteriaceae bacterium]